MNPADASPAYGRACSRPRCSGFGCRANSWVIPAEYADSSRDLLARVRVPTASDGQVTMTSAEHPQGPAAPVELGAADSDDSQSVERDLSAASHASVSSSASDGQSGTEMTDQATDRHAPRLRTRAVRRPRRGEAHGHQHR